MYIQAKPASLTPFGRVDMVGDEHAHRTTILQGDL